MPISSTNIDFGALIRKDREDQDRKRFEGTFLDYLNILKGNPEAAQLAHSRMHKVITSPGVRVDHAEDNPRLRRLRRNELIRKYTFFEKEFFGMDKVVNQIVRYFHSASMGGEESRQVLYLVGPVGAGKSSLMEKLKAGLEQSDPIYCLHDCPMHEEPLHLIPNHLREEFSGLLGITIEGDLCPICRFRLKNEFNGEFEKFPVETMSFSIRARRGIGVVPPVDPNNQDTSILIGSEDISKMDLYSEDDPRVLALNGAFNAGNRGLVEFIEVFKNETEYLHAMITATQEKMVPAPGKHSMIYFDGVILAHSNEAEWEKFKADHTNEAILDRIVKVEVPYVLELDEEVKIYRKIIQKSRFDAHVAPHTIEVASMFAILTRLQPTNKCDLLTKLKLYNGDEVIEKGYNQKIDVEELREEAVNEGMSGISTRFIMKSIDNAISDAEHNCINPISVREAMIAQVKEISLGDDVRKRYLGFLQDTLHKEYLFSLEKEITKAFVHSYSQQAETLFQNYLDHAEAYVNRTKVKDPNTKEELEPDQKLLRSIEEQIGITVSAAEGFRQDVSSYMFSLLRRKEKIDYKSYAPLREAIEKKLMTSVRDLSRIVTKTKTRDKEQTDKYELMVKTMIENNGYCPYCCDVVLRYAANNLWKD
jgi:serine protein kinase